MLSHFYQPDMPPEIEQMGIANWIDVLGDLPKQAVDDAITEWLRGETKRPTPADIRLRAKRRIAQPELSKPDDSPFRPLDVSPEELARRRDVGETMANVYKFLRKIQ